LQHLKLKWLIFWWTLAILWFGSWLIPVTRGLWDVLDETMFFNLNGLVANSVFSQSFWAIANWRPFDIIAAMLILAIGFSWIYKLPLEKRLPALSGLGVLLVIILTTRFSAAFVLYLTDYQRYSPSITLSPTYRLSELVTWIDAKDYHKDCFPGDHGYVVIVCIVFFFLQAGRRWGIASVILLSPFILPRMVSGAHWATDIIIGSATMALISMPLLFATPLYAYATTALNRLLVLMIRPLLVSLKLV
jgi:membrane-associated phospholipid phosphatase